MPPQHIHKSFHTVHECDSGQVKFNHMRCSHKRHGSFQYFPELKRTNPAETTTEEGLRRPRQMGLCVVVRVYFLILPLKELHKVVKSCRDHVFRFFPSCFRFRGWFECIFVCTYVGFMMCYHGFTYVVT